MTSTPSTLHDSNVSETYLKAMKMNKYRYITFHEMYNNLKFEDVYSEWITICHFLNFLLFMGMGYLYFKINIHYYQSHWNENKCNVLVMPFAGLIQKKTGVDILDFTEQNFASCSKSIISSMIKVSLEPIVLITQGIQDLFVQIEQDAAAAEAVIAQIEATISNFINGLIQKALNVLVEIQKLALKVEDMFNKLHGAFQTGIYVFVTTMDLAISAVESALNSAITFLILTIVVIISLSVLAYFVPPVLPIVIGLQVNFVIIAALLAIVVAATDEIFHFPSGDVAKMPSLPGSLHSHRGLKTKK